MVQLKSMPTYLIRMLAYRFNSCMVQLKLFNNTSVVFVYTF